MRHNHGYSLNNATSFILKMIMRIILLLLLLSSFLNICTVNVIDYPLSFSVVSLSLQVLNNNVF